MTTEYGYDGRDRFTAATRSHASGSGFRATYTYTYDLGDNLLSKSEPFIDDFDDGNRNRRTALCTEICLITRSPILCGLCVGLDVLTVGDILHGAWEDFDESSARCKQQYENCKS